MLHLRNKGLTENGVCGDTSEENCVKDEFWKAGICA